MDKIKTIQPCYQCGQLTDTVTTVKSLVRCTECQFASNLKSHYGMTIEDYNALLTKQENRCAICRTIDSECKLPGPRKRYGLVVDHCHTLNHVRGLLCHACNTMLGASKDSTDILYKGIVYLLS